MIVTACNIFDKAKDLLPHYFNHYAKMGVERFYFGIYGPPETHLWNEVREIGKGMDIQILPVQCNVGFDVGCDGDFKTKISKMVEGWVIPTDLDEFHTIEGYTSFPTLCQDCETEGAEYVWSKIWDRTTKDWSIPPSIDPVTSIWEQFPCTCHLTNKVVQGYCRKLCMVKAGMNIYGGHHRVYGPSKQFSKEAVTYHFKWFGQLLEREKRKLEIYTKFDFKWRGENERLIKHLEEHGGKLI